MGAATLGLRRLKSRRTRFRVVFENHRPFRAPPIRSLQTTSPRSSSQRSGHRETEPRRKQPFPELHGKPTEIHGQIDAESYPTLFGRWHPKCGAQIWARESHPIIQESTLGVSHSGLLDLDVSGFLFTFAL